VWKAGIGTDISFGYDYWIDNKNLIQHLDIQDDSCLHPCIKVSEFILNGQWDIQKLNQLIHNQLVLQKIIRIAIPIVEIVDSFCWRLNGSGEFSTKSATWLTHGSDAFQQPI